MKNQRMRVRALQAVAVLGVCCALFRVSLAQAQTPTQAPDPATETERVAFQSKINELEQADAKEFDSLLGEFAYARRQKQRAEITILIEKLHSTNPQIQSAAAYLLGVGRYPEAVADLSNEITLFYQAPFILRTRLPFLAPHPAAAALAAIGKPATGWMLHNLEASDDAPTREWSLRVIQSVEGTEVGTFILERAAARTKDAPGKARLIAAAEMLPKLVGGVRPELNAIFSSP